MIALVGSFNQEKALVEAFSVITNVRMDLRFKPATPRAARGGVEPLIRLKLGIHGVMECWPVSWRLWSGKSEHEGWLLLGLGTMKASSTVGCQDGVAAQTAIICFVNGF